MILQEPLLLRDKHELLNNSIFESSSQDNARKLLIRYLSHHLIAKVSVWDTCSYPYLQQLQHCSKKRSMENKTTKNYFNMTAKEY